MNYSYCMVLDRDGKRHDVDLYTTSLAWVTLLRALRRECKKKGIEIRDAYVGGNMWSRHDIESA